MKTEKNTLTANARCRRCCQLTLKKFMIIISNLLLPLILIVFTIVITLQQRQDAEKQRQEDQAMAREQRFQDLNLSLMAREQDKDLARQQRDNDRYIADLERNMSREINREQYEDEREHYFNGQLTNYLNEIGQLLKENNGSLVNNPTIHAIARAKTLHILRSDIGPVRAVSIIRFLYDAQQLISNPSSTALDLSDAQLNDIDLSGSSSMYRVSLAGAHLRNAYFSGQNLSWWNFTRAVLINANFSHTDCTETIFDGAILKRATFFSAKITSASFRNGIDLTETTFEKATTQHSSKMCVFQQAKMTRVNFNDVHFVSMSIWFTDCYLVGSTFHHGYMERLSFTYCNMTSTDFINASLSETNFTGSLLMFANLVNTNINQTNFDYTNLVSANMTGAVCDRKCTLEYVLALDNTILPNGTVSLPKQPILQICNISLWHIDDGIIREGNDEKCIYKLVNNYAGNDRADMRQNISVVLFMALIKDNRAFVSFRARLGDDTSIGYVEKSSDDCYNLSSEIRKSNSTILNVNLTWLVNGGDYFTLCIGFLPFSKTYDAWLEDIDITVEAKLNLP